MQIVLTAQVVRLGSRYLAVAEVGGFTVRGPSAEEPVGAYRNLLWKLGQGERFGPGEDEVLIGLELHVHGTTLEDLVGSERRLTDGADAG